VDTSAPEVEFIDAGKASIRYRGRELIVRGRDRVWFFREVVLAGVGGVCFSDLISRKNEDKASQDHKLRLATSTGAFAKQGQHIQRLLRESGWGELWSQSTSGARWTATDP
jgi:hypothetical protein